MSDLRQAAPSSDPPSAISYLRHALPGGPWTLNKIPVEGGPPTVATFGPETAQKAMDWILQANDVEKQNVYYAANPSDTVTGKKAHISQARMLWADCDPDPSLPLEAARQRIRERLLASSSDLPPPSVIIDSGRGFWPKYFLEAPEPLDGGGPLTERYEARNAAIAQVYQADDCWNVDRICRLPGTINWPSAKKLAQGATPRLAKVIAGDFARYPISAFPSGTLKGQASATGPGAGLGHNIFAPDMLESLADLDAWGVSDRLKLIIEHGRHPNETKRTDPSRSEWVYDVVCGLTRAAVPAPVQAGVLLDPRFKISASVLEKGTSAIKYAYRQIERAAEAVKLDDTDFKRLSNEKPIASQANIALALHKLGVSLRHDLFKDRLLVDGLDDVG